MKPILEYDLLTETAILVGGAKATDPIKGTLAATPHEMHRANGVFQDGTAVRVAQRQGRGGMDFNKLLSGKVFAVAADGFAPVMEKDDKGNRTNKQKEEEGLPLYSASGFYLLSSKEYPALQMFKSYLHLKEDGNKALLITDEQLAKRQVRLLTSEADLAAFCAEVKVLLSDENNAMQGFAKNLNLQRKRKADRAKQEVDQANEDAEANGDPATAVYDGIEPTEVPVSAGDGAPLVLATFKTSTGVVGHTFTRDQENAESKQIDRFTPEESIEVFLEGKTHAQVLADIKAGGTVSVGFACGHSFRTSVSFRKKVANLKEAPANKKIYGDGPFITAAQSGWVRSLNVTFYSWHPNFPVKDYDVLHFVVAPRQAEVGFNKGANQKFGPPQVPKYPIGKTIAG